MSNAIPTAHRPNLRHLEIHITYRCNLRCTHCSNLITQAPSNEVMPLERVLELLNDSARLQWPWEWLVLHGGEPTLHPRFEEICNALAHYKFDNPAVNLFVCTNGYGAFVQKQLEIARRYGVQVENSGKDGKPEVTYHVPLSVSALDTGEDYTLGCFQSSKCGIAFTNQGFFECSPAGAAHRVFGYEPMATRLADVTEEVLAAGYAKHCMNCGYARVQHPEHLVTMADNKAPQQDADPSAPMSKTWVEATERYKEAKA